MGTVGPAPGSASQTPRLASQIRTSRVSGASVSACASAPVRGLGNANRQAGGVVTGDEVEVEVEFDPEPRVVAEPADLARALDADPLARAAYNRLPYGLKLQHVRAIESAKKPETRRRRIEKTIAALRDPRPNAGHAASVRTSQSGRRSPERGN
jgi:uncharacterized protein YdeI (YjbR/CyaY-like superfamily)